jgi:hypothetical protein
MPASERRSEAKWGRPMKILVTGTEGSGIDRVERDLQAAGHVTTSCAGEPGARGRCRGTEDTSACPFVEGGVDLIVAARERPLPHLTKQEQLVGCVLLNGVPLVVVGSTVMNPYGKRAAVLVEGFDEVVAACEAAVTPPDPARVVV